MTEENIEQYLDDCIDCQTHLVKPGEPVEVEQMKATASSPSTYFIGILKDNRIVGLGVLNKIVHPVRTNAYVDNIVVHPDARGLGLFGLIMDNLEAKTTEWGATQVALTCSRAEVQGMYEKRGYIEKDTKYYTKQL